VQKKRNIYTTMIANLLLNSAGILPALVATILNNVSAG
jgi:hypothetical protein